MRTAVFHQITDLSSARGLGYGLSKVASVVIASGGTGYRRWDVVTALHTGSASPPPEYTVAPTFRVLTVSGSGRVLTLEIENPGVTTTDMANPVSVEGGTGDGLTLTITWDDNAIPPGVRRARVTGEAQTIRWRDDGVAPSSSVGHPLPANTPIDFGGDGADLTQVRLIQSASSAKANVSFYGD